MLKSNKLNFIIAIISAIAIWVYVVVVVNPNTARTLENIPIEVSGTQELASRGLVIASMNTETARAVIEGPRSEVYGVLATDIFAKVDVTGFKLGDNEIVISMTVPNNVKLVEARPEKLTVRIEKRHTSVKSIEAKLVASPTDMEATDITLLPHSVELSGTKSQVESVEKVIAEISLSEAAPGMNTLKVYPVAYDEDGKQVLGVKLSQEEVEVSFSMYYLKEVDLSVDTEGEPKDGLIVKNIIVPSTVWLKAKDKNTLKNILFVKAANISIADIGESGEFPLTFDLPNGIELSDKSKGLKINIYLK